MATLARLGIIITADDRTTPALKNTTSALRKLGKQAKETGEWLSTRVSLPLIGLGAVAVKTASDLNESMSKTNVVFGDAAAGVIEWSEQSATAFGMSQRAALETAATFGNLFGGMGVSQTAAAEMSESIVQLAADLSSFNNVPVDQVLQDLRSGLVGEAEPLRKYGILLDEATVAQKAMAMTGKTNAKMLTQQEKLLARNALIFEQTTTAQGDFARTSGGLANQLRILRARTEDLLAQFGTIMIPVVLRVVDVLGRLAGWVSNLSTRWKTITLIVAGVLAALGPLLFVFGQMAIAISALLPLLPALGAAFSALLGPLGLVIAAVALFAVAYSKNWLGIGDITRRVVSRVVQAFSWLLAIIRGGKGLHNAIADLPAPLQKLAILLRRIVAIGSRFVDAWRKGGPVAAFRALSRDIEKIGRTLGNLFKSIGLERFGNHVAQLFRQIGKVIRDVVKLVDDLVHGRWSAAWRDLQRLAKDAFTLFLTWLRGAPAILRDLFDLALRAIRNVDWGGVASWLLEQGGRLLRGLYEGALGFVTGTLIPWLGGLLPQVPGWIGDAAGWLWDKGTQLIGGLWDGIRHIWNTKLKDFFGNLPSKIAGLFPEDAASRLWGTGKKLLGGLWDGISWTWDNVVKPFFSGIVDRVVGAMPSVMNLLSPLINAGKAILNGIWSGVTWVWDNVVKPFFSGIVDAIFAVIPGWDAILSVLKPVGENLIKAIAEGINAAWSMIVGIFTEIGQKIGEALDAIGKVIDKLTDLKNLAGEVWDKLQDIAGWVGGKLGIGGGDGDGEQPAMPQLGVVPFAGEGTLEDIRQWVADVQSEFAKLSPWLIPAATGQGAVGAVASMTPASFDGSTVLTSIQTWATSVKTEFETMKSGVWDLLGLMALDVDIQFGVAKANAIARTFELARGVENELIILRDSAKSLAEAARKNIVDGFSGMGRTLTQGEGHFVVLRLDIVEALTRTATEAGAAASGVRRAIVGAFANMYGEGFAIGSALGRGINDGIAWWISAIAATAANAVIVAIQAAKNAAGIASPSKVMMTLGEQLMSGLAVGIDRATDRAALAMSGAMGAVVAPAATAGGRGFINYGTVNIHAANPADFYDQIRTWEASGARR